MSGRELVDLLKVTLELGPTLEDEGFGFADELNVDLLFLQNWPRGLFAERSACQAGEQLTGSFHARPRLLALVSVCLFDPLV